MINRFFFAVLIVFFILCASCYSKEPVFFTGEDTHILYALSKKAYDGVLAFSDKASLEYAFDSPFVPDGECSLVVDYVLRSPSGFSGDLLVIELGNDLWELPQDLSFMGEAPDAASWHSLSQNNTFYFSYAIPIDEDTPIEKIVIRFDVAEKTKKEAEPVFEILDMSIEKRWYGFSMGNNKGNAKHIELSPFVFIRNSNLIIDPPPRFRSNNETELKIVSTGGHVSLGAGNSRINTSAQEMNVPSVFIGASSFPLSVAEAEKIVEVKLVPARTRPFPEPIPSDPGMILSWPKEKWRNREYEIFSWEKFPSILIFDMADYNVQDLFLKRLAFYVEKAGYRGRIVPYEEIEHLHGWNAHDYRSQSLADFFETARRLNLPLLDKEQELKTILLNAGIIRLNSGGNIIPGEGAVISISRQSPDYLRSVFMVHEGFHGLYFIDNDFRDFCRSRWESFRNPGRRFILSFFDFLLYDTNDTDLVINEFMAYLLQQGITRAGAYFGEVRPNEMIKTSPWRRSSLPEREEVLPSGNLFWPEIAEAFTAEAEAFSRYVNRRWGLEAGRVRTVTIR